MITEHKAGPAFDALVAKQFMLPLKPYSTDLNAAWDLVNLDMTAWLSVLKERFKTAEAYITYCQGLNEQALAIDICVEALRGTYELD